MQKLRDMYQWEQVLIKVLLAMGILFGLNLLADVICTETLRIENHFAFYVIGATITITILLVCISLIIIKIKVKKEFKTELKLVVNKGLHRNGYLSDVRNIELKQDKYCLTCEIYLTNMVDISVDQSISRSLLYIKNAFAKELSKRVDIYCEGIFVC